MGALGHSDLEDIVVKRCQRCGRCCEIDGIYATPRDIQRWLMQKRYDILQYLLGNPWRPFYESGIGKPLTLAEAVKNNIEDYSFEREVRYVFGKIAEIFDNNTDLWYDPITGEELTTCPFLHKPGDQDQCRCLIHETKPEVCSSYYCSDLKQHNQVKQGATR